MIRAALRRCLLWFGATLAVLGLASGTLLADNHRTADYWTYRLVADADQLGLSSLYGPLHLNDRGSLLFVGVDSNGVEGLYLSRRGMVSTIYSDGDVLPSGGVVTTMGEQQLNNLDQVLFPGADSPTVYNLWDNGTTTQVTIGSTTGNPLTEAFAVPSLNDAGQVLALGATASVAHGLFLSDVSGAGPTTVTTSNSVPNFVRPQIDQQGNVYTLRFQSGVAALTRYDAVSSNAVDVYNSATDALGWPYGFDVNAAGQVLFNAPWFSAGFAFPHTVYLADETGITPVATRNFGGPGFDPLVDGTVSEPAINDFGQMVYVAENVEAGVRFIDNGQDVGLLTSGDAIDGRQVVAVDFTHQGFNNHGQLALAVVTQSLVAGPGDPLQSLLYVATRPELEDCTLEVIDDESSLNVSLIAGADPISQVVHSSLEGHLDTTIELIPHSTPENIDAFYINASLLTAPDASGVLDLGGLGTVTFNMTGAQIRISADERIELDLADMSFSTAGIRFQTVAGQIDYDSMGPIHDLVGSDSFPLDGAVNALGSDEIRGHFEGVPDGHGGLKYRLVFPYAFDVPFEGFEPFGARLSGQVVAECLVAVPEPSGIVLLGMGAVGLLMRELRRRRRLAPHDAGA
ncbi:MAG: hypothetical protein K1X74_13700 [Pirellulales bacterium]|nr:hypothetical protein [Pirellulales bacterium]